MWIRHQQSDKRFVLLNMYYVTRIWTYKMKEDDPKPFRIMIEQRDHSPLEIAFDSAESLDHGMDEFWNNLRSE